MVVAIEGTAGVGKTALAVHWAHRVAAHFPDGQLYVDLRGFDPDRPPMPPAEAVRRMLDALQVPPATIPADPEAQLGLYRSVLAHRRMLVVLDNGRDSAQVRPPLPGAAGCRTVVTSRSRLTCLVAEGARLLTVGLLPATDARRLLETRLGADRVSAEPLAVAGIIDACAGLPLALTIVAAHAVGRSEFPLTASASQLREAAGRLEPWSGPDPVADVRAVFSWSYRAVSPDAARLFRLVGLHPGTDIAAPAAASLAGVPMARTRRLLAELTGARLLSEHLPGRYTCHDLLRAYAVELTASVDSDVDRAEARSRLIDHFLHTAYAASRKIDPHRAPLPLEPPRPGVVVVEPTDHAQAYAWCVVEHPHLMAVGRAAATDLADARVCHLAVVLTGFLGRHGHWPDAVAMHELALASAHRLADRPAQAKAHLGLADAYASLGRFADAHRHYRHCMDDFVALDDLRGQAVAHYNLAWLAGRQRDHRRNLHHCRQAHLLHQRLGDRAGQARTLNKIGWVLAQLGHHRFALSCCQRALRTLEEIPDLWGAAITYDSLGFIHHQLGDSPRAITPYQRALDLLQHGEGGRLRAEILSRLGDSYLAVADRAAAGRVWRQARKICDELGLPEADEVRRKLTALAHPE